MAEPLQWILIAAACLLAVGLIITAVILRAMKKREYRKNLYTAQILLPEIRKTLLEAMGQSMDMIPGKISEIRKTMEE